MPFVSCHVTPCHSGSRQTFRSVPFHFVPSHPFNTTLWHTLPCRAVPCRAVPCRAVPCRAVPCRAESCRAVSRCAVTLRCPSSVHEVGLYVGLFPAQLAPLGGSAGSSVSCWVHGDPTRLRECTETGEQHRTCVTGCGYTRHARSRTSC